MSWPARGQNDVVLLVDIYGHSTITEATRPLEVLEIDPSLETDVTAVPRQVGKLRKVTTAEGAFSLLRSDMDASRREVDEIRDSISHELTVKAVVEGLTCSEISYSVSATNRDVARGELDASCKDTFET